MTKRLHHNPIVFWGLAMISVASFVFGVWGYFSVRPYTELGFIVFENTVACDDDEFSEVIYSISFMPEEGCISRYDVVVWNRGTIGLEPEQFVDDVEVSIPSGGVVGELSANFRNDLSMSTDGEKITIPSAAIGPGYSYTFAIIAPAKLPIVVTGSYLSRGKKYDISNFEDKFFFDNEEKPLTFVLLEMTLFTGAGLFILYMVIFLPESGVKSGDESDGNDEVFSLKEWFLFGGFIVFMGAPITVMFLYFMTLGYVDFYLFFISDVELPEYVSHLGAVAPEDGRSL